jgi:hypothetical protein
MGKEIENEKQREIEKKEKKIENLKVRRRRR